MSSINLSEILKKIKDAKIGIIGDFCLDVYWHINESKSETSVETMQQTRPVEFQKYSLGGAGNVANNIHAIGVKNIQIFGVVDNGPFGQHMRTLLQQHNINNNGLITQESGWATHVYIKPINNNLEENRIDFGNYNVLSKNTAQKLLDILSKQAPALDIVIINQQVISGIHSLPYFRKGLQKIIDQFPETSFIIDSRHMADAYNNVMHKINAYEAAILCGLTSYQPDDFISLSETTDYIRKLYSNWQKPVFVTRGARGCLVASDEGLSEIHGLHIIGKTDTVGAGDSMLAGITACLASGYSPSIAAVFGNFVAGVTVQKLFCTGTASPAEIRKIGESPEYVYHVEKADDIRKAEYYDNSEIEIITKPLSDINLSHIIFDHDGTISTLREGWEKIMEPMMVKAILGSKYDTADETVYHRVLQRTIRFINETTGVQTLIQMQGLIQLIKEFGFVPNSKILDEHGYKAVYNKELQKLVRQRIEKLKNKELDIDDFTIKGCIPFMKLLSKKGITLYLASGSDENDVIAETEALGYASLFEGRVFGAVGDVSKEAKRIVMDRILQNIGTKNSEKIAAIGDGPVEIREIKKRGGIAIGIASNEIRRYGINHVKRKRLIRAGADIIISDYSQLNQLNEILNLQ